MYNLACDIRIDTQTEQQGSQLLPFRFVHTLEIKSSWKNLTDTCRLEFPRMLRHNARAFVHDLKRGQVITVNCGYTQTGINQEFKGNITRVLPEVPVVLECEDLMYKLKQKTITKSWDNVTIAQLLQFIMPTNIPYTIHLKPGDNGELGTWNIIQSTAAQVLQKLKEDFNVYSFFRNGHLHVGLAYVPAINNPTPFVMDYQRNVIESNVEYKTADEMRIKINAVSHNPRTNEKIVVDLGDEDGDIVRLRYLNVSEARLRQLAQAFLDKKRYEGLKGTLTTFGYPFIQHGDKVKIVDRLYPEREGIYRVDAVTVQFGINGFRRILELGPKELS